MRVLAITAVLLIVMAWQYRKNTPLWFVIIATLFADAAMLSAHWEDVSNWPLRIFSVCWLACMLPAGGLFILSVQKRKRDKAIPTERSETR
jgi:hypothetical protein